MKRVKIMLTAVILLGTVGGVLAYKAKRNTFFCTAATVNHTCSHNPNCGSTPVKGQIGSGAERCTTATIAVGVCPQKCPVFDLTTNQE